MIIDGNAIANDILKTVAAEAANLPRMPVLAIITAAPNFETQKYLALKRRKAADVGIGTNIIELPDEVATENVLDCVRVAAENADGVILQLPFPKQVDITRVLAAVPSARDVDALNPQTKRILSPVVGACKEILRHHNVPVLGKRVTVLGRGRLVGMPAESWFVRQGADVTVVTKEEGNIAAACATADIIVCGAGSPSIVTPKMVKNGVVILDAGTSEAEGMLRGDADPACAEKAAFFTPVPGGIGPVTIAMLFKNLLTLAEDGI